MLTRMCYCCGNSNYLVYKYSTRYLVINYWEIGWTNGKPECIEGYQSNIATVACETRFGWEF